MRRVAQQCCRYPFAIIYQEHSCIAADACGSRASSSSSSSLNPRAALNLPRLNFAPSLLPTHPRASLFNYYSPRGLRHFQGVLTITDGTGGSHTRRLREAAAHRHAAATLFSNPLPPPHLSAPPRHQPPPPPSTIIFSPCRFLCAVCTRAHWQRHASLA